MNEREGPCDETGKACEYVFCCEVCNDDYCARCYRFRDWDKDVYRKPA